MPVETVDGCEDGGRGIGGEGDLPLAGEERVKAEDLPAGGGDVVNNGDGNGVEGKVDGAEIIDEAVECGRILIREDGAAGGLADSALCSVLESTEFQGVSQP